MELPHAFRGSTPPPPPAYTWPVPRGTHHPKDDAALEQSVLDILDSDDPSANLARGAAEAVWLLLQNATVSHPTPPAVLDEDVFPLCDPASPLVSVAWTLLGAPQIHDSRRFVLTAIASLEMTPRCVVTAVVILEAVLYVDRRVLCARSARPLVLASCALAVKLTADAEVCTNDVFTPLEHLLTGIDAKECASMEKKVLDLLDWRFPNDPRTYQAYARELTRLGQRAGGAALNVPPMFDAWVCVRAR